VQEHQGELLFETEPNNGRRFMWIAVESGKNAGVELLNPFYTSYGQGLVVDDERASGVHSLICSLRSCDVTIAEDASRARCLQRSAFDVVSRISSARWVSSCCVVCGKWPEIEVVVMTGEAVGGYSVEAVRRQRRTLVKPVNKNELRRCSIVWCGPRRCWRKRLEAANRDYQANRKNPVKQRTQALRETTQQLKPPWRKTVYCARCIIGLKTIRKR
jgi:hypothetical protein